MVVVSADILEAHVVGIAREEFEHPGFRVGTSSSQLREAERALEIAETELDTFAADTQARNLLGHRYHQALEQRIAAMDEAREALREALAAGKDSFTIPPAEVWDQLEPAEMAQVLRAGLEAIIVRKGRMPIAQRVTVIPKGLNGSSVPNTEDA